MEQRRMKNNLYTNFKPHMQPINDNNGGTEIRTEILHKTHTQINTLCM